ncbi:hypothetical protein NADFUDRAFT_53569 [Nadsonia fulvescens var. elongata DSM 6958]|uniref:Sortilin N-terminal domain-containing protein n=1 Tax=Nadsonia fulvescens var. elongata DSM 6958 TaxID=857566 RepID=A0A1E3PD41_9ASCO|nr:hypothetical protein NADFUDRAFT_53569 [Nadsonia fulvescens var. elongata DSM 6958]
MSKTAVSFLVTARAVASSSLSLSIYVSKDAINWNLAELPGEDELSSDSTFLGCSTYSLRINILRSKYFSPIVTQYYSNSDGTKFTKNLYHVLRTYGTGIEKVANIDGILFVDVIDNWKDITNYFE